MRARKENEKSLKGAQSELVQLLRQGDQVIKSPWSSFQFGTGYMNNDWGTTYRGRGGKFLEYYKRDNDLTKYVFDPTKHLYGATNLNIPRNKEPNSLTINPANIHEPYKPYVPERLDNVNMPVNPTFDPTVYSPNIVNTTVTARNAFGRTPRANTNTIGGTSGSWSNDSTFTYGTSNLYRAWNGWSANTMNTYNQRNGTNNTLASTTLGGASSTSEGDMTIGGNFSGTTSVGHATGTSTWWWDPSRTWSATVRYQNLSSPAPGSGTTESYTPNGGTAGYDGITSAYPGSGYWWYNYWGYGGHSSYQQSLIRNYHTSNPNAEIGGSRVTYQNILDSTPTGVGTPPYSSYTVTLGGVTATGATEAIARQNLFYQLVDAQYNNSSNGWSNWYTVYREAWTPGGSGDADRDVLISNTGQTVTLQNFNAHVLGTNDAFAQIQGGKYSVNNVEVDLNGTGKQAAFVIDTNTNTKSEIAFGTSGGSEKNKIYDNGVGLDGEVIFNFQNGNVAYNSEVEIKGTVDIDLKGNNSNVSVYRVNNYIGKLQLANGDSGNSHGTLGADNLQTSDGSTTGKGRIWVNGNDNVVYDGQGFVNDDTSKLTLSDVQMKGNNNVMVALKKPDGNASGNAQVGAFAGKIYIQGAMFGDNNVVVDAASGQGSGIGKQHISSALSGTLDNVKVEKLNVGFGIQNGGNTPSRNNTLIKATNGTTVEVTGKNTVISDSVYWNAGAVKRDYDDMYLNSVAEHTIVGYADGVIQNTGYAQSTTSAVKPSRIEFKSPVDMAGKASDNNPDLGSIAYFAINSGSIDAKSTRAAAPQSIIAYANGANALASINTPQIKIEGDINATDYLVLNTSNGKYGSGSASARPHTYQNIGAYAENGGTIKVVGANASADVTDYANNKSLIYGIGAVATGPNSNIEMEKVSVVSGASGALYATNGGSIKYEGGNILHQNNKSPNGNGDITLATSNATFSGTRKGMAPSYTGENDHANISPFYVHRTGINDTASIDFGTSTVTNIDMYDGILLSGNKYNGSFASAGNIIAGGDSIAREWDYAGSNSEANVKTNAKYKGMDKVTANILSDNVTIGVINQPKNEINWNSDKSWGAGTGAATGNFLSGIGEYAGGMKIKNGTSASDSYKLDVTIINGKVKIGEDVNLENKEETRTATTPPTKNDPFNDIKMESTFVTIDTNKKVEGDVRGTNRDLKDAKGNTNYQLQNVGLSMANSLFRWNDVYGNDTTWRKTKNSESGFVNKGTVDITGGSKDQAVTALNVSYGTIQNEKDVKVDHGNALVGTDNSILTNTKDATIEVSGKYTKPTGLTANSLNINSTTESTPSGANYGIVGISRKDTTNYLNSYTIDGSIVDTDATAITSEGKIKVDGGESNNGSVTATGIFAKNVNAKQNNVTISYDDTQIGNTAGIEVQASGSPSSSRGVGIALVNENSNGNGGLITLKGFGGSLGSDASGSNDIVTKENGIGIYAENAKIQLNSDKFTVTTRDDGVGIWVTDNSEIATGANHNKTFQYNYFGKNNKNGFAMAFGGRNTGITHASNDLDIKFSNHATSPVDLAYEQAKSKVAAVNGGTYKGIAGILVNTNDGADTVTNRGNIEEDSSSKTNVRAYGAVVNKGTFVNFGKIKLNDSLDAQASTLTSEDMKKVNVGIFANSTNKLDTTITNRGDITIGDSTNNKNIGSWAIYGYNVNTDSKEDGTKSKITINRNNYGIYSGDGNVNIKNTKLLVGNDTVLGHVQTTSGVSTAPGAYPINRQTAYANANDLLSGLDKPRELDSAIGVYIDKGSVARNINVSADMDIDRFSYGIVMAEKNGGPATNVTIGDGAYTLDASGKV
ncbi:autotransporter-associated N-terminal domain-containing protein, partial [Leptotrichia wadei]